MIIKIVSRYDNRVILSGKYKSIKDCLEKNKGADLGGAYLRGANLEGADLGGAYLEGANLGGAENYLSSHDFFQEIIKRQKVKTFTNDEWAMIGQIIIYRLCWETIKKRWGKKIMPVFKKLTECGFDEWEKYYKDNQ